MRLTGIAALDEFGKTYNQARARIRNWRQVVENSTWKDMADITQGSFRSADLVGGCFVFNIGSDRIIAQVDFELGIVNVVHVLTHDDYDRGRWKSDCGC